jgi:hypothetical protein
MARQKEEGYDAASGCAASLPGDGPSSRLLAKKIYGVQDGHGASHRARRKTHEAVTHGAYDDRGHRDAQKEGLCEVVRDDPRLEAWDTEGDPLRADNDAVDHHDHVNAVQDAVAAVDDVNRSDETRYDLVCDIPCHRGFYGGGPYSQNSQADSGTDHASYQRLQSPAPSVLRSRQGNMVLWVFHLRLQREVHDHYLGGVRVEALDDLERRSRRAQVRKQAIVCHSHDFPLKFRDITLCLQGL